MLNCLVDLKPNKDYRRYITLGVIKWRYLLLRLDGCVLCVRCWLTNRCVVLVLEVYVYESWPLEYLCSIGRIGV